MFLILTASSDTYITNKIIDNKYRASSANVGRAGTLDLFKLYNESTYIDSSGAIVTGSVSEDTRLLIKFDLDYINELTGSLCDLNSNSFRAHLQLFDVMSGLPVPNNFSIIVNPLSRSFDEGRGRDVSGFSDLDACNYVTASYSNGAISLWNSEGCNTAGHLAYISAVGSITATDPTINGTLILSDGTKTVTFTSNAGSTTAAKVGDTNYTFGTQGLADVNTTASRIYDAIALSKTNSDLAITAVDPGGASALISLTQDETGPAGNTLITGTATGACTIVNFKNGYDASNLDYFTSGSLSGVSYDFGASQIFAEGTEKFNIDVTTAVSASVAGIIPNSGFRISFSGSYDTDTKTRFAKRFASRQSKNGLKIPRLMITFDSHTNDYHPKMRFNETVDLFLTNKINGKLTDIKSGSEPGTPDGTIHPLTGTNCLKLTLTSGSVVKKFDASQVTVGTDNSQKAGTYKATFLLNRFDADFFKPSNNQSELIFSEVWSSNDFTVPYYSGTLKLKTNHADADTPLPDTILVNPLGHKSLYYTDEDVTIRFFMENLQAVEKEKPYKLPRSRKTIVVNDAYYRVRDAQTSEVIVPFDTARDSTRLSTDSNGMYMVFKPEGLPEGRQLVIDLLIKQEGNSLVVDVPELTFKVKKR